jgi:DNA-binding GntR family transcriptional regulator
VTRPVKAEKGEQRQQSLADRAFESIEEMIVGGMLAPGSLISESELSKLLKMGRTPIREAIARLRFIGFVDVHARKGISVSGIDVIRHLEVLEVRRPLEEAVVLHAIERATESDLAELAGVSRELVQVGRSSDRIRYFRVKRALHEAQVRATHNHVLAGRKATLRHHRAGDRSQQEKGNAGGQRPVQPSGNSDQAGGRPQAQVLKPEPRRSQHCARRQWCNNTLLIRDRDDDRKQVVMQLGPSTISRT